MADPDGMARKLLPVRVEDCARPGLLGQVVTVDLFGLSAAEARDRLLSAVRAAIKGRAKPASEPAIDSADILAMSRDVNGEGPWLPTDSVPGMFSRQRVCSAVALPTSPSASMLLVSTSRTVPIPPCKNSTRSISPSSAAFSTAMRPGLIAQSFLWRTFSERPACSGAR